MAIRQNLNQMSAFVFNSPDQSVDIDFGNSNKIGIFVNLHTLLDAKPDIHSPVGQLTLHATGTRKLEDVTAMVPHAKKPRSERAREKNGEEDT